jgi:hypothetical protein
MKRRKPSRRVGLIIFLLPLLIVAGFAAILSYQYFSVGNGTLFVNAVSSGRYSPSVSLKVQVKINGMTETTPFNTTEPDGTYVISFSAAPGYATPENKTVVVSRGSSVYAVATYSPTVVIITLTADGFTPPSVNAVHGVTPVVWVDRTGVDSAIEVAPGVSRDLFADSNVTYIYQVAGTYTYSLNAGQWTGTVSVG